MNFTNKLRESKEKDTKLSKTLSWLLRHAAVGHGLEIDKGGFIDVEKILSLKYFEKCTADDIKRIVDKDEKKRYALRFKDNSNDILQIRANQGHSIPVGEEGLLKELTLDTLPLFVYHGTYFKRLKSIKTKGLSRMFRNHIHFTKFMPGQNQILSGMRRSCQVAIEIDSYKAYKDGIKFYLSANEVILSPGNEDIVIPSIYFRNIIEISNRKYHKRTRNI